MKNWKLISGVFLVFILGILVGLLPGFYFSHRFPPPLPPRHMDSKSRGSFMLERLSRDLDLTEDQKTRIGKVIMDMEEKLDQHFRSVQPEVKAILDDGFSKIETELDPLQKKKFYELKKRMEKYRKHGPPPPPR